MSILVAPSVLPADFSDWARRSAPSKPPGRSLTSARPSGSKTSDQGAPRFAIQVSSR